MKMGHSFLKSYLFVYFFEIWKSLRFFEIEKK